MKHHDAEVQIQPQQSIEPTEEMISPTESDVARLAAAMHRTAHDLADARQSRPDFRAEVGALLAGAGKRADDLELPEVAKALTAEA
ncbi:hypothetical protein [Streptomyces sp. IBSBF 2806]|uniref:hypothetical protein n=1 Tax=Streptomyces sp. IBSBF 2806 TaxID=2903529 RepID=UPI002FDC33FE